MTTALFTMRMAPEERAELDLLVKEGGFRSGAACLKWLVRTHVDRDCTAACQSAAVLLATNMRGELG